MVYPHLLFKPRAGGLLKHFGLMPGKTLFYFMPSSSEVELPMITLNLFFLFIHLLTLKKNKNKTLSSLPFDYRHF
jgi:hypothetical protein